VISYQLSVIIYQLSFYFCDHFFSDLVYIPVCSSRFSDSQAARYFVYPLMHIQTTWRVFDTFTIKQRGTSMPKPLVALKAYSHFTHHRVK